LQPWLLLDDCNREHRRPAGQDVAEAVGGHRRHIAGRASHRSQSDRGNDREALRGLGPLWDELFPAEQDRIMRLLVDRVDIGPSGADVRLRLEGLASLVRDLGAQTAEATREAA
jgi:hypothetical protein